MEMEWDAKKYARDFSFVAQYGNDVLTLLDVEEGSSVLDLGCGNGALTNRLSQRGIRAIGLDASKELLHLARHTYPDIPFIQADATDFTLEERVDAVFSNAVLHWIDEEKQPQLLQCVHAALKDKGQFVFELGGAGNNRRIHRALDAAFREKGRVYKMPFYFPTIGQYAALLEQAGFKVTDMHLFDRMTRLNGENGLEDWIYMFIKTPFERMTQGEKEELTRRAVDSLRQELCRDGIWYADYVRLRGRALLA